MDTYSVNFCPDPSKSPVPLYYLYPEGRGMRIVKVNDPSKVATDAVTVSELQQLPFVLCDLAFSAESETILHASLLSCIEDRPLLSVTKLGIS